MRFERKQDRERGVYKTPLPNVSKPTLTSPTGDQVFRTSAFGEFHFRIITFHSCSSKTHGHVITQNAISSSPKDCRVLTVSTLFKNLNSKLPLRVRTNS